MTTEDKKCKSPESCPCDPMCRFDDEPAEDSTENMPEAPIVHPTENGYLIEFAGGGYYQDEHRPATGNILTPIEETLLCLCRHIVNLESNYSQAELDRRVAEAEKRQRENIYEQMYLKIGNWGGPQREAFDQALILLGAILNAGGNDSD